MIGRTLALLCATVVASSLVVGSPPAADERKALTVCADPDNLPFSNQKWEGFADQGGDHGKHDAEGVRSDGRGDLEDDRLHPLRVRG